MELQSGAEVRRLHIVYFLSRKGRIDHPHLIRVHHLSRNGVRLRDVKRWLGELRGKDIPESFSWSFKRKYKTGHVWQDLLDDDLITPISDNEYVLKGSEISSKIKAGNEEEQKTSNKEENQSHSSETSITVSTKSSSEIEEESPTFGSETSTLTDDSARAADMAARTKSEKPITTKHSSTSYFTLLSKKSKKKSKKVSIDEKVTSEEEATANAVDLSKIPSSEPQATKNKNHSNGASQLLRNLMTCGDVDTIDTRKETNKQTKPNLWNMCRASDLGNVHPAAICKRDGMSGGSQRIFGNPQWTQQQWGRKSFDDREQRALCCAAYKPVNGPNCSQCGKLFKPEKLHNHMKSCKGLKALSKCDANNAGEKASKGPMDFHSFSGHLLSH